MKKMLVIDDDAKIVQTLALTGRSTSPVAPEQPPEPQSTTHRMATTGSPRSPPRPPARITGQKKILIVEDDRKIAMALGAAGFLEKPFEVEELIAAIQNALNPQEKPEYKMAG
jgi:hypothetical protein